MKQIEDKLSLLQSFFDDVEDVLTDTFIEDDEALEELSYILRQYKIKLHNANVINNIEKGDN